MVFIKKEDKLKFHPKKMLMVNEIQKASFVALMICYQNPRVINMESQYFYKRIILKNLAHFMRF